MFIYSYERLETSRIFFGPPLAWEETKFTEFKQIKLILTNWRYPMKKLWPTLWIVALLAMVALSACTGEKLTNPEENVGEEEECQ